MLELARSDRWEYEGFEAAQELRRRRPDLPLMLAVTEPALDPDPLRASRGLSTVLTTLGSRSWASELGLEIEGAGSIGVLSLGHETLMVLEAACSMGETKAVLRASSKAVARGLGYLRRPISLHEPSRADVLLLPGVARDAATMWTYRRFAAAAWRATGAVLPVIHPAASLSPLNRLAFRAPAGVNAIEIP